LAKHWVNAAHLKHQPLNSLVAACHIQRDKLVGFQQGKLKLHRIQTVQAVGR